MSDKPPEGAWRTLEDVKEFVARTNEEGKATKVYYVFCSNLYHSAGDMVAYTFTPPILFEHDTLRMVKKLDNNYCSLGRPSRVGKDTDVYLFSNYFFAYAYALRLKEKENAA